MATHQVVVASIPNFDIVYCVSNTTEEANLYISGNKGKKYKIYKRGTGSGLDYQSLVSSTMYKGTAWHKLLHWYFKHNVESILLSKLTFDGKEFGAIHLNGALCGKICYKMINLNVNVDDEVIEDMNIYDFEFLIKNYLHHLKEHFSYDFIMADINHFKIYKYLPSQGCNLINHIGLFLMTNELGVDRYDILQSSEPTIFQEEECDVC